jgi:hypothetical protein
MPFSPIQLINFISLFNSILQVPYTLYNSTFSFFAMNPLMLKINFCFFSFSITSCAFGHINCCKLAGSMAPTCRVKDYHLPISCLKGIVQLLYNIEIDIFILQIFLTPLISFFDLAKSCLSS